MLDPTLDRLITLALEEDLGPAGDLTTNALVPESQRGRAELWAKEEMVLSGMDAFARVFERVDPSARVETLKGDGERTGKREKIANLQGSMRGLLIAERTALNIVQRTSGIATLARQAADAVKGSKLRILDTRKTSPGMRGLSKRAVKDGGAVNHRYGLSDGVLIKDNHIAAVGGSIKAALDRARESVPRLVKIEIEVTDLKQLQQAIDHGADIVLLDNMDDETLKRAVAIAKGQVELEASGGITLERLPRLAKIGVDYVSMGALTHSARAMDLSLEVLEDSGSKSKRK